MFDVSWSELLILGLVTLIFVGPKELPRFLGTLGRYAGMVRRQANEFRSVFEQAMREAELDQIQKEIRSVSEGVKTSLDQATRSVDDLKSAAKVELDAAAGQTAKPLPAGAPSAGTPAAATPAPETEALQTPAIGSSSGDTPAKSLPEKAEAASAEEKSTAGSA
ncbi:Sec-independent protein translocase subunit TatA/TatB [Hyphomicrobium sp.]|uniref:Sec-independent protein translocase subunit TatA/TatB n=1 Tax=Hyphomicrobium sp. TaxID=82 RepID=UPI002FE117C0